MLDPSVGASRVREKVCVACRGAFTAPGRKDVLAGVQTEGLPATEEGGVKPEEVRAEILRLEEERLRIASDVMGGNPEAFEEDQLLERRIMELANADREARSSELIEGWRQRHVLQEDQEGA